MVHQEIPLRMEVLKGAPHCHSNWIPNLRNISVSYLLNW